MDNLSLFDKYGLQGLLVGVIVVHAGILLRSVLTKSDKATDDANKATSKAVELLQMQIAARDADLSWARAKIDDTQRQFLEALRSEREAREKMGEALLMVLRSDHKEAMEHLTEIRTGIDRLTDRFQP